MRTGRCVDKKKRSNEKHVDLADVAALLETPRCRADMKPWPW